MGKKLILALAVFMVSGSLVASEADGDFTEELSNLTASVSRELNQCQEGLAGNGDLLMNLFRLRVQLSGSFEVGDSVKIAVVPEVEFFFRRRN